MTRFWTLARLSVALQLALVILVVVVLVISMQTLVNQTAEFGRQAEERAESAERATLRNRQAIETVTCILLISPDERTPALVLSECGVP